MQSSSGSRRTIAVRAVLLALAGAVWLLVDRHSGLVVALSSQAAAFRW